MSDDYLNEKELRAFRYIRNCIVHEGFPPTIRDVMAELEYKSSRAALLIVQQLIEKGWIERRDGKLKLMKDIPERQKAARVVPVPIVGSAPCGLPLFAEQNIEGSVLLSESIVRPGAQYFLLRALGDSMNKSDINHGDLVLFRQQEVAENGDIVVALINDEATIKEFQATGGVVCLIPNSNNLEHKKIFLTEDFQIQGVFVMTLPNTESLIV